ncbi:MAG: bifunctional glutamate N-acetyltransferase/amino-acid acetyltransferase ArgJ [Oscillospiraceae bacterium]|nr:bifunctional glutamate N-acetyltransferase/amino-acid acetyltransferase ArgJ [Oscillospiraceae bacterium]
MVNNDKLIPAEFSRIDGGVTAPLGYSAGAVYVGVKSRKKHKPDLAVLYSERECACGALFTTNRFCAAPVLLGRELLKRGRTRAIVVNSGNANAGTGERGLRDARTVEAEAEHLLGLGEGEVFVCSTGVIGEYLPVDKILGGLKLIVPELSRDKGSDAAWAICTTDRTRKEAAYELRLSGGAVRIGVMAKGSGMIHPNMATMLLYITSDVEAESAVLQKMLADAADNSFHMLTVDGDTSTNDSAFLIANGASGVRLENEADRAAFYALIEYACIDMARRIASDGEGSTHLIEVRAEELPTLRDARLTARSIAGSTLFKAAVNGRDANWGRIMAAAGYSGADVDPAHADCVISSAAGEVQVMRDGFGTAFDETLATAILSEHDVTVTVRFHQGCAAATAWGCDLTREYVRLNGDYRT